MRNGFGPIPKYFLQSYCAKERRAVEFHSLLKTCTYAEEAAKHQITSLVCLTKYSTGNIGCKGNTACVFQDCKLACVLPNTSESCYSVVITQKKKSKREMVSKDLKDWKFEKWRIMHMLELLIQTVDYVWKTNNMYNGPSKVVISQENASLWPEEVDTAGKEAHQGDSDDEMMTDGTLPNAVEGRSSYKTAEEAPQTLDEKA
eukprot:1374545-Ditylum_brightwellii.AAC.1